MNKWTALFIVSMFCAVTGCAQKDPDRPLKAPGGYMNETLLKVAYGLGMLDLIEAKPEVPESIVEIKDVEYKRVDSISLQLDIYKSRSLVEPAPALIFVHGGSWSKGKRSDYLPYLLAYAAKGYVTVTVSYRLVKVAKYPAAVQDVNCAVRWIKAHGREYGINPDRLALVGGSAGGHLSMMVGYASQHPGFVKECQGLDTINSRVKAVINLYGPTDLTTPYAIGKPQTINFLGCTFDEDPDRYIEASPKTHISPDDPPTLTFHGTIDSLVPISQSDSLDVWLSRAGVPHEYHRLKGWPHTMDVSKKVNTYCQFYIDRFLEEYL